MEVSALQSCGTGHPYRSFSLGQTHACAHNLPHPPTRSDFDLESSGWDFGGKDTRYTLDARNGMLDISDLVPTDLRYQASMYRKRLALDDMGTTYTYSFRARADSPRDIFTYFQETPANTWPPLSPDQVGSWEC